MKNLLLLFVAFALLGACKSGRQMVAVDDSVRIVVDEPAVQGISLEITVIEESFEFEDSADRVTQDLNRFFVIVGSFRVSENAARFRTTLEGQGFNPSILLSETGFNRVSVNSYTNEADARARVLQIRRDFPSYHDTWLLIRRQ